VNNLSLFQNNRLALTVLVTGLMLLPACAERRHESMPQPTAAKSRVQPSAKMGLSDGNIMALLAVANESDIEGGQLAEVKASSPQVRSYGSRMISEHASMLQQGNQLSKQLRISPIQPEPAQQMVIEHKKAMDALKTKSGGEFDRAYIEHDINMHQRVTRLVDEATKAADSAQLRTFLERSRPALEDHLEQARNVKRSLVASR
jgi:putative membrane protein